MLALCGSLLLNASVLLERAEPRRGWVCDLADVGVEMCCCEIRDEWRVRYNEPIVFWGKDPSPLRCAAGAPPAAAALHPSSGAGAEAIQYPARASATHGR